MAHADDIKNGEDPSEHWGKSIPQEYYSILHDSISNNFINQYTNSYNTQIQQGISQSAFVLAQGRYEASRIILALITKHADIFNENEKADIAAIISLDEKIHQKTYGELRRYNEMIMEMDYFVNMVKQFVMVHIHNCHQRIENKNPIEKEETTGFENLDIS
jgi:hypothetical protein